MGRVSAIIVFVLLISSCYRSERSISIVDPSAKDLLPNVKGLIFDDSTFNYELTIFDTAQFDSDSNNAVFKLIQHNGNNEVVLVNDSIYCMRGEIEYQDFNNDKVRDLLVFHYSGARANPTYYLYLMNGTRKTLTRVKGFEEIPNPDLDTSLNIITGIALSSSNRYSFYRIDSSGELVNLGHAFTEEPDDSLQYDRAIKLILLEGKNSTGHRLDATRAQALKAQTIDKNYVINWIKAIDTSYQPDSVIQYHIDRDTYYSYDTLQLNSRLRHIDISRLKSIYYSKYKMDNYVPGKGTIYILTIKKLKTDDINIWLKEANNSFVDKYVSFSQHRISNSKDPVLIIDSKVIHHTEVKEALSKLNPKDIYDISVGLTAVPAVLYGQNAKNGLVQIWTKKSMTK